MPKKRSNIMNKEEKSESRKQSIESNKISMGSEMNNTECCGKPTSMGCPQGHWMNKMHMRSDKTEMETAPEAKPETPPSK
jgi:hypothetical protein